MKVANLFILTFCSLIITNAIVAQRTAPGFMGKRVILKYDQGFSWSLGSDARGLPNFIHTIQTDISLTTKRTIDIEYSFMYRKYMKELGDINNGFYSTEYIYDYYNYYRLDRSFMHSVGIHTKFFSQEKGHIAPAGPYFAIGLNMYLVHSSFSTFSNGTYKDVFKSDDRIQRFSFDFGPTVGGGKNYIFGKKLLLSVDVRFSLPLIGLVRTINHGYNIELTSKPEVAKRISMQRWGLWPNVEANLITLRIGIGTLL